MTIAFVSPELRGAIEAFLGELRRMNSSEHTIRNYTTDLMQFLAHVTAPGASSPAITDIDTPIIRGWLSNLHKQRLSPATLRRKVSCLRSLFKFMQREGIVGVNVAQRVRLPKSPNHLPSVPPAEQANALIDEVASNRDLEMPFQDRDVAIFEVLYGCGLRISELVGLNIDDCDFNERWIRVRGKGKKERQIPFGSKAAAALERYLAGRQPGSNERAVFLNHRKKRLTDRGARGIVKVYCLVLAGDSQLHAHSLRHAFAVDLLRSGADLRAIQDLLGHTCISTTQKYLRLNMKDIGLAYDRAHPRA